MRNFKHQIHDEINKAISKITSPDYFTIQEQKTDLMEVLTTIRTEFDKTMRMVELAGEVADIGLWEYDIQNDTIHWSEETYRIWGYNPESIAPHDNDFEMRIHPEDLERVKKIYKQSLASRKDYHVIYRLKFPDDSIKFVEAFGKHVYNDEGNPISTIGTNQNITKREKKRRDIETSLDNHRSTLNEIHHRVKNNLGVLAGTMQLQLLEESDEILKNKLLDSTNRIRTMANVHEQLYQSKDINEIPLGKTLEKIAFNLIHAMPINCDVRLNTHYEEIYLNTQKNMSCSLLVNEIITNALKHAFTNQESGEISIFLKRDADEYVHLSVTDDGKGLPDDFQQTNDSSLGMKLIATLCRQLKGEHTIKSTDEGTNFSLKFPK